jgi:hypothetical protein
MGCLVDFRRFSDEEKSKWLIDIAHDICDPVQTWSAHCVA